jgi:hypothetical protein
VVLEITIKVHRFCLARLELTQSFLGEGGKLRLGGGKCFGPAVLRLQFREEKRCDCVLFLFGQLGGCRERPFKKLSHGLE